MTCCRTAPGRAPYITQPEILEYLESVVDRFDLRRHFRFGTAVTSAIYSDDEGQWEVTTDDGAVYHATYVINAVGLLSAINFPNLPGLEYVRGRDHPHRRLARGQGPHGPPRRRHRHRFDRPAGDHRPGAEGRAADRFRPDPAVFGPGRQSPGDRRRRSTR